MTPMRCAVLWAAVLLLPGAAAAAEFAAAISPPRFELEADPGDVLREVITINNIGNTPAEMLARTADWSINDQGGVIIFPETLQPGSCRPWTLIERHRVSIAAQRERRYRFEVHVPEDAPRSECRFAILFQQAEESADSMAMGNVNLPVLGRIAVIVYVRVGDAKPQLKVMQVKAGENKAGSLPVLVIKNAGDAHGRAQGILTIEDAAGESLQATVSTAPILPGKTRSLRLWPAGTEEGETIALTYPVTVTGTVEWDGGEKEIDAVVNKGRAEMNLDRKQH